jgi:hypothetical protein
MIIHLPCHAWYEYGDIKYAYFVVVGVSVFSALNSNTVLLYFVCGED